MTKHLGDLCLQAGLYGEAISHYNAAADNLRAVNDWLWIASNKFLSRNLSKVKYCESIQF